MELHTNKGWTGSPRQGQQVVCPGCGKKLYWINRDLYKSRPQETDFTPVDDLISELKFGDPLECCDCNAQLVR